MTAVVARADMGMLWLWITTGILLLCAWRMSRWPWVRRGLDRAREWVQTPHPLLWIVLVGALMRVPRLYDSLWYDETFTARIASLGASQFMPAVQGDVHPLWYAVEWITVRLLGNSEAALRLPAMLCGLLLIVYGYRLALALKLSRRTALVYAGLLAVLPAALYYSAEARGYSLLAVLVFGALIALLEDRPWIYLGHAALLPLVHNIGYVYLGVFTLAALYEAIRARRRHYPGAAAWTALAFGALIPGLLWLPTMLAQSRDISDGFWLQGINAGLFLSTLTDMTVTRAIHVETVAIVMGIAIAATILGVLTYWRWLFFTLRGRLYSALVFGVPVLLALAAWLWAPVYLTRALLPVGLGLALLWAMLLVHRPLSRLFIPAALGLALISFYTPGLGRFNFRAAVDTCADAASVFVTNYPAAMFASYYLPNAKLRIWKDAGDLNQTLQRDARNAMGLTVGTLDELPGPRCVLVLDTSQTTDAERAYLATLLAGRRTTETDYYVNQFYQVRVIEL
jgi:hypothetical protein